MNPLEIAQKDQAAASFRNIAAILAGAIEAFENAGLDRSEAYDAAMTLLQPVIQQAAT